jgi:hypothetical protein
MKIIGIIGKLGQGKTMTLALISHLYKLQGWKIYSNVKSLKDIDEYVPDIKEDFSDEHNVFSLLALDEIYLYIDSRVHGSKKNRIYSYILMQSRKNNFDIIYTTNYYKNVDIRLRRLTDYVIECSYKEIKKGELGWLKWTIIDEEGELIKEKQFYVDKKVFNLYNTKEKILMPSD